MTVAAGAVTSNAIGTSRPTSLLPRRQLALISVYWFGINAVWGAYESFGQKQVELIVGKASVGTVMGALEFLAALIPILTVPVVGALSDYTTTRFGKRKGYIITGTIFDLVFISGLSLIAMAEPEGWDGQALGTTEMMILYGLLLAGLQFSSNVAQGPYQGLVPDLVAEPQVGVASSLVGIMRTVGLVGGIVIMTIVGIQAQLWGLALFSVGAMELVLALLTFLFVDDGPPGKPRGGRSWLAIARETWDLDILRERSFVRMTLVRLLFLMAGGAFMNISLLYVERVFGVSDDERTILYLAASLLALLGVVGAAIPAARLSDRFGRKPVVWGAAVVTGTGILILAIAPTPLIALAGTIFFGAGYGSYLAVDWALMTDIIPLASSGRFMGIANIANSISGPLGLAIAGPVMDAFYRAGNIPMGPRVAVGLGVIFLALASLILIGVHPRRDPRDTGAVLPPTGAGA